MAINEITADRIRNFVKALPDDDQGNRDFVDALGAGEHFEFIKNGENDLSIIIADNDGFGGPGIGFRIKLEQNGHIKAYRTAVVQLKRLPFKGVLGVETDTLKDRLNQVNQLTEINAEQIPQLLNIVKSNSQGLLYDFAVKNPWINPLEGAKAFLQSGTSTTSSDEKEFLLEAAKLVCKAASIQKENIKNTQDTKNFAKFINNYYSAYKQGQNIDIFVSSGATAKTYENSEINPQNFREMFMAISNRFNLFDEDMPDSKESHFYKELQEASIETLENMLAALADDGFHQTAISKAKAKIKPALEDDNGITDTEADEIAETILSEDIKVKFKNQIDNTLTDQIKHLVSGYELSEKDIVLKDENKVYIIRPNPQSFDYSVTAFSVANDGSVRRFSSSNETKIDLVEINNSMENIHSEQFTVNTKEISEKQKEIQEKLNQLTNNKHERNQDKETINRLTKERNLILYQEILSLLKDKVMKASINSNLENNISSEVEELFNSIEIKDLSSIENQLKGLQNLISERDEDKRIDLANEIFKSILEKLDIEETKVPKIQEDLPELMKYFTDLVSPRAGNNISHRAKNLIKEITMQLAAKTAPSQRMISELREEVNLPENFDLDLKAAIELAQNNNDNLYLDAFAYDKELQEAMAILNTNFTVLDQSDLADYYKLYLPGGIPEDLAEKHKDLINTLRKEGITDNKIIKTVLMQLYLRSEAMADNGQSISTGYLDSSAKALEYQEPDQAISMEEFRKSLASDEGLRDQFYEYINNLNYSADPTMAARMAVLHSYLVGTKGDSFDSIARDAEKKIPYLKLLNDFTEANKTQLGSFEAFQRASNSVEYAIDQTRLENYTDQVRIKGDKIEGDYQDLAQLAGQFGILYPENFDIVEHYRKNYGEESLKDSNVRNIINSFQNIYSSEPNEYMSPQEFYDRMALFGYYDSGTRQFNTKKLAQDLKIKIDAFLNNKYKTALEDPRSLYGKAEEVKDKYGLMKLILKLDDSDLSTETRETIPKEEISKSLSYFIKLCSDFIKAKAQEKKNNSDTSDDSTLVIQSQENLAHLLTVSVFDKKKEERELNWQLAA